MTGTAADAAPDRVRSRSFWLETCADDLTPRPGPERDAQFDVVVVVEPAHIAAASIGDVYVAMTRPTRRLHAIYRDELPDGWPAQDHDVNSTAAPHRW